MKHHYCIPIKGGCYRLRSWLTVGSAYGIVRRTYIKYSDTSFRLTYH